MGNKKQRVGLWQSLCLYVANNIPIETRKRSKAGQLVVVLHYLVDYLILWFIIQLNYNPGVVINFNWPFVIARAVAVVLFLIWKQPFFFLFGKLVFLMQFILSVTSLPFLDVLIGLAEVAMAGVWALTKEQRMLHFDSRYQTGGAFLKQAIFYATVTVQAMLPNGYSLYQNQFALLGCVVVMTIVDFSQVFYNKLTKAMFLRLDAILLLLAAATIYQNILSLGFLQFIFASLFLFAVTTLHLFFAPATQSQLFKLNSQELNSLPEEVLMEAMIELKRTAQGKDGEAVETYLFKLREEAEDEQLIEKIAESQEKGAASRRELLNNFIFQTLKRGAKSSKRLRDLVIYLYSPSPRLYCFLDLKDWQHLREYRRIIAEELNDSTLREAEAEKELEVVKELVQRYTRVSSILLQQLMKERIRKDKVERYGDELIELLEQLQRISIEEKTKSNEVRDLINRFALDCLPPKYRTVIMRGQQSQGGPAREDLGQVVVGGEEDNYLTILQANNCFTKIVYTRKEKYLGRPLAVLLPPAVLAHINRHIKSLAQKPEENVEFKPGYLFNSLGFVLACRWKVEPTTHRSGRAWKLSFRQEYTQRAFLVLGESGQLEGFSELARYFGLAASQRGKKMQSEAVVEIKSNAIYYMSIGENLFEDHEFYMPKGAVLSVLDDAILEGCRFWVLEIKETDMKLKSLANPLVKTSCLQPPNFEFHFDWANTRITTEPVQQRIKVNCGQQQQRLAVNYGENITEMRYFQQRIDYKSNFEEERDCPSLQPHIQKALSSLSVNEFHQKWDRKKNSAPLWFKASVAIIILLALVGVGSAVFYLMVFNSAVSTGSTTLQVSTKLQEKLQSVVLLGELTTLPLVNSSANTTQAITAQLAASSTLSTQLYSLDQNIFNNNGGQVILNLLNGLSLQINSYLLTPNYPYRNALSLLTTQIVPAFNTFITSTVQSYSNSSSASSRAAALICLSVACFGLFAVLWVISLRQSMRRQQVAQILKFIDNEDLQTMRERTLRFKETWLDNVDCKQPEEQGEDQPDKDNSSPPKHLLTAFRIRKRNLFHLLWLGGFVALLILINRQTSTFTELANNYVAFQNNLAGQVTALQAIWAELNQVTPNATLIKGLILSAQEFQYSKNVIMKGMAGSGQVDTTFINNYGSFWESITFCNYISDPNCNKIIGGAMSQGANMAICYLNIQHDSYLGTISSSSSFNLYSLPTQPNVALLSLYYLPTITYASNQFILAEYDNMSSIYSLATQYFFIGLVMHSLLVLVLLQWVIKERKTNSRIEELLMIMPFEKLKNFSAFHKYYLKYYATF